MKRLVFLTLLLSSVGTTALAFAPELHPDGMCVDYHNYYQMGGSDKEVVTIDGYEAIFRFFRGMGYDKDIVMVEVPSGMLIPDKYIMEAEENERDRVCFRRFEGF